MVYRKQNQASKGFTLYAILGLLIALGAITSWGLLQKAKLAEKEGQIAIYKANIKDLKGSIERQLQTISNNKKITHENTEINRDLHGEIDRIRTKSFAYQQQVQERRANEFNNALAEPFRSGNVARANLNKLMCAFASQDTNCHDTDTTGSRDPPTTDSAADEDTAGVDTIES